MDIDGAWKIGLLVLFLTVIAAIAYVAAEPRQPYSAAFLDANTLPNEPVSQGARVNFTFYIYDGFPGRSLFSYEVIWDNQTGVNGTGQFVMQGGSTKGFNESVAASGPAGLHKVYVLARSGSLDYWLFFPVNVTKA